MTVSPTCSVRKNVRAAESDRCTHPADCRDRLPVWNAMPPSKKTDQGMGASSNSEDLWSASFQVTWKVPGEVRSPGRPVVIGAESTTRPSRTSHARLRKIETHAPSVSPQGRPALVDVVVVVVRCAGAGSVVTWEVA